MSSEDKDTKRWKDYRMKRVNSLEEEESHLDRLWGKAKGFASRKKVYLPRAKYTSSPGGQAGEEDGDTLELLEDVNMSSNGYRNSSSGIGTNRNKGIFDDI